MKAEEARKLTNQTRRTILTEEYADIMETIEREARSGRGNMSVLVFSGVEPENEAKLEALGYTVTREAARMNDVNVTISWV